MIPQEFMEARQKLRWLGSLSLVALAALAAGCGGDDGGNAPPAVDAGPPIPAFRVLVDANRDGRVDDADFPARNTWTATAGAAFLANVDDDDEDGALDGADEVLNGDNDALDLAPIVIPAWPAAPEGATATVALEGTGEPAVRLFRRVGDAWARFTPGQDTLDTAALRAGVTWGIESADFPTTDWDGTVRLRVSVTGAMGPLHEDTVALRVAPFLLDNSVHETERIIGPVATTYAPARRFYNDLTAAAEADAMELYGINTLDRRYHTNPQVGPDVWMQDIMEFGWTSMPGPNGPHAMHVVLRSPNRQRPMATWGLREYLGPDRGYVWKSVPAAQNGRTHDVSLDSFGNLELLPPYRNGERNFPLGRIIHGWTDRRTSDVSLRAFLDAQRVQGPVLQLNSGWLHVGHIDEFLSFIPANTPRGWKLLWASPRGARTMLQRFVDAAPGNGERLMFAGQRWYHPEGHPQEFQAYPAQRTVRAILEDAEIMAFNQQTQGLLDGIRQTLQEETGVTDEEIIEIPFLFWEVERGLAGAYMPGTVNLLRYGNSVVTPRPHGPVNEAGEDIVELDMIERLRPDGVTVHFAEQWDLLHAAQGEVHCGTNAIRAIPNAGAWFGGVR